MNEFINIVKEYAIKENKVLPSLIIAQAILESGWGKSFLSIEGKNLFGIKKGNWQGEVISLPTKEYENNRWITVTSYFRKYNNYGESIKDHTDVLMQDRYQEVVKAKNYIDGAKALQRCGYATDPNYATLLIQIIEENNLFQYDIKSNENIISEYEEIGKAYIITDMLNVRNEPTTKSSVIDFYKRGEYFYYDKVIINDGYYWTSYISYSGTRRYVASRKIDSSEIYLNCI